MWSHAKEDQRAARLRWRAFQVRGQRPLLDTHLRRWSCEALAEFLTGVCMDGHHEIPKEHSQGLLVTKVTVIFVGFLGNDTAESR